MNPYKAIPADQQKAFARTLHKRLSGYFREGNRTRKADHRIWFKAIFAFGLLIIPYAILFMMEMPLWAFFILYFLHSFGQLMIAFNIGHDANHGALTSNKRWTRILYLTYDLVGLNSYIWRIMHSNGHHPHTNINPQDQSIMGRGLFRFSPKDARYGIHKIQHIYVWFFYALVTLDYVFVRDFKFMFGNGEYNVWMRRKKHAAKEYIFLFAHKIFYVGYTLIIPALFLDVGFGYIFLAFVLSHLVMGSLMAWSFQVTHTIEDTYYPEDTKEFEHYFVHIFATTADYAWRNPVWNWLLGGLNMHLVHHLGPATCHVHYLAMTKIMAQTAAEFGIPYRESRTFWGAVMSHIRFLKDLGSPNSVYDIAPSAEPLVA